MSNLVWSDTIIFITAWGSFYLKDKVKVTLIKGYTLLRSVTINVRRRTTVAKGSIPLTSKGQGSVRGERAYC